MKRLLMGQSSTGFGGTLFLACKHLLVCKMTDDYAAKQQIWGHLSAARIFAEQKSLRRTSASKFAARQHNHQLSCKPVSACKPERECYQKPQKIAPLKGSSNLEPPGFQKGCGPFVSEGVQRKPFQGFPLGNFFAAARHRASLRS